MYLERKIAEMTPEQIEIFNHGIKPSEVKKHSYSYAKVDGYYRRRVYDFEVNDEIYHIRDGNWTNGGFYTVVWNGEEENYPDTAMGVTSSHSMWASAQRGVNMQSMIEFIYQNPNRFKELYKQVAGRQNACGLFPSPHIESIIKHVMQMPTESKMKEMQEEQYATEVAKMAEQEAMLEEKAEKVQELLEEYEKVAGIESKNKSEQ